MSRKDKQRAQLAGMEADLRAQLIVALERAAQGKEQSLFTNASHNPFDFPEYRFTQAARDLDELSLACLELRDRLDEPDGAPVAALFRRYLARSNDRSDHHRPGVPRLAAELLAELRALPHPAP